MDHNDFFVHTLDELESKAHAVSSYDLIRISALLRQLLLDREPLVHRVNRNLKMRIQFQVQKRDDLVQKRDDWVNRNFLAQKPCSFLALHGISPHENLPTEVLSLDQFLALKVLFFNQFDYSIHEVIDYTAHKTGGVHFDDGKRTREKDAAFDALRKTIQMGFTKSEHFDVTVGLMVPIAIATVIALSPLKRKIQEIAKGHQGQIPK